MTSGALSPLSIICALLSSLSLSTALFIAFNRLKTILYIRKKSNDATFFRISVLISFILALPSVLDLCIFSKVIYKTFDVGGSMIVMPRALLSNQILRTSGYVIQFVVSLATLVVNIILSILITGKRKYRDNADRQKFNGERGLVVTSIVSYAFYMLFYANNLLARFANILFCGFAQWLFLGLNSITPFWCLLLFAPTVRRFVFKRRRERATAAILRHNVSALFNPLGIVTNKIGQMGTIDLKKG